MKSAEPRGRMKQNTFPVPVDSTLSRELLVFGAGIAGICAAIAAARNGCDVMLLEVRCYAGNERCC